MTKNADFMIIVCRCRLIESGAMALGRVFREDSSNLGIGWGGVLGLRQTRRAGAAITPISVPDMHAIISDFCQP